VALFPIIINTALDDEGTESMAIVIGWDAELR